MGAHLPDASLESRGARGGVHTLRSSGSSLGWEFPLIVGHHTGGGVYGETVSQPLLPTLMWVFACLPDVQEMLS